VDPSLGVLKRNSTWYAFQQQASRSRDGLYSPTPSSFRLYPALPQQRELLQQHNDEMSNDGSGTKDSRPTGRPGCAVVGSWKPEGVMVLGLGVRLVDVVYLEVVTGVTRGS
jgi:hypothetical protein